MKIRLNKHLAALGYCSRRKADQLIVVGKVKVNGKVIRELGTSVDTDVDEVTVIGQAQKEHMKETPFVYIALNKPIDYITSTKNEQGSSVMDLLTRENYCGRNKRSLNARVFPVGRLDKDSEGLVLLTNDGELANLLTHPRYEHEKEYEVRIDRPLMRDAQKILKSGMRIDGEMVSGIEILSIRKQGREEVVTVILKEGKNRQIRKMFGQLGYNVHRLKRTRIGNLSIGTLPVGQWKFVRREQICYT